MPEPERMTPRDAYRAIIDRSGTSRRKLSKSMGRTPTYLSCSIAQGSMPNLDLFVEVANATGYRVLVERGEEVIEVVRKEDETD